MIRSSKGIILKVFPYSNTSVICNVFTDDYGKLTFIAKGVRKPKNPLLSILQPFNLLEIQYYHKKNRNMQLIKEADILITFEKLRQDYSGLIMGGSVLNIINRIFEQEYPNTTIFRLIYKTLNKIADSSEFNRIFFIFFLFHLSKHLGVMPNITQCHVCNKLFVEGAIFSSNSKSLVCFDCHDFNTLDNNITIDKLSLHLLDLINTTNIDDITDIEITSEKLQELYNFLIFFMKCHINHMHNVKSLKEVEKIYYGQ